MNDNPYAILFEPVKIGPVTAPNRFYQVPHCNGMGYARPNMLAAMRGVKAEGGWGVVCTEEVEIHPSSDLSPHLEGRLWDDGDCDGLQAMVEAVHAHGALAGIELAHNGFGARNMDTRLAPMAPSPRPTKYVSPYQQARGMTLADIADYRQWHRDAVKRAKAIGFDLIYVYAGHNLALLTHFLSRRYNQRSDDYGGSLENRARLLREVLMDTKEIAGDTCGIVLRFAVDELLGGDGLSCEAEGRDIVEMLAEMPDLWDVNVADWSNDSVTSRFAQEGYQEDYIRFVKKVTNKPVVGVGRYTSPDTMVRLIRSGVMDLIGAARPSIADPFLPNKVKAGRLDDIRECIGCNICVTGDHFSVPIRCTQNPTMGEEWRRGWHPERMNAAHAADPVLVVGAGPAGLEAALSLARRGYDVTLAEASDRLGGRVLKEAALPGLAEWKRVADYRVGQLKRLPNVQIALDSRLTSADIREFGAPHVLLATGAYWRDDGLGYARWSGLDETGTLPRLTPDDVFADRVAVGRDEHIVIYDDDHYYLGSVLAELLVARGCRVTLVCSQPEVACWTHNTLEQERIQRRLLELGVKLELATTVCATSDDDLTLVCNYSGRRRHLTACALLLVTARLPNDALLTELDAHAFQTLRAIGDAHVPGIIAAAVYDGHRAARELGGPADEPRRERGRGLLTSKPCSTQLYG